MLKFIVGEEEPRRVPFISNLPNDVLEKFFDMVKDVHSEDIQKLLAEDTAQKDTTAKPAMTLEGLAVLIRAGGFTCYVAGGVITVLSGTAYKYLPSNQYVAKIGFNGKGFEIDSEYTEQDGAVENLIDHLAMNGVSIGTPFQRH